MEVKRGRGRPKGSKNKPKEIVEKSERKRGRPKGSKNKPKDEPKRKPGRPRKIKESSKSGPKYEGVSWVKRKKGSQSESHRWIAVIDDQVIGYYKTAKDASKAYDKKKDNINEN